MSQIVQNARISLHRFTTEGDVPTIPVSNDHTDATWISTDIYPGEITFNMSDDLAWFRSNNGIIELISINSPNNCWARVGNDIQAIAINATDPMILPTNDDVSDLGSSSLRWKDLYLGSKIDFTENLDFSANGALMGQLDFVNNIVTFAYDDVTAPADSYMKLTVADANLSIADGSAGYARIKCDNVSEIQVNNFNGDPDLSGASTISYLTLNQAGQYTYLIDKDIQYRTVSQQAVLDCTTHVGQTCTETSDASATTILTVPLASAKMMSIRVRVNGYDGGAECCGATAFAVFNGTSQVGSTTVDVKSTTAQTISISASGSNALVQVHGKASTSMWWVADHEWSYLNADFGV